MLFGYIFGYIARDSIFYNYVTTGYFLADNFDETVLGYNLGRLLITIGHIGLIGLIMNCNLLNRVTGILVSVGRLALTNYIMQTILSLLVFYAFTTDLLSIFTQIDVIYVLLSIWIFQICFSVAWLRYFKLGPLEWLWRSLIYGKTQPLKLVNTRTN